jgi:hypothetical protein
MLTPKTTEEKTLAVVAVVLVLLVLLEMRRQVVNLEATEVMEQPLQFLVLP